MELQQPAGQRVPDAVQPAHRLNPAGHRHRLVVRNLVDDVHVLGFARCFVVLESRHITTLETRGEGVDRLRQERQAADEYGSKVPALGYLINLITGSPAADLDARDQQRPSPMSRAAAGVAP